MSNVTNKRPAKTRRLSVEEEESLEFPPPSENRAAAKRGSNTGQSGKEDKSTDDEEEKDEFVPPSYFSIFRLNGEVWEFPISSKILQGIDVRDMNLHHAKGLIIQEANKKSRSSILYPNPEDALLAGGAHLTPECVQFLDSDTLEPLDDKVLATAVDYQVTMCFKSLQAWDPVFASDVREIEEHYNRKDERETTSSDGATSKEPDHASKRREDEVTERRLDELAELWIGKLDDHTPREHLSSTLARSHVDTLTDRSGISFKNYVFHMDEAVYVHILTMCSTKLREGVHMNVVRTEARLENRPPPIDVAELSARARGLTEALWHYGAKRFRGKFKEDGSWLLPERTLNCETNEECADQ
ncbi:unnamed protein product [Amoebophrya sp. A25]|nr:unnamed protein product [Amoebophrya sp. A25]|eukprot:GSA25T00001882001.1